MWYFIHIRPAQDAAASIIQRHWKYYYVRKNAAIIIQRAWRKARYTPGYILCEQTQFNNMKLIYINHT